MYFKGYQTYRQSIDQGLLAAIEASEASSCLKEGLLYALEGGKRLRSALMLSVCKENGGDVERCLPFACALEMMHTASLIHDDLPALDNDAVRHQKPSSHVRFGEAQAILHGDAMIQYAHTYLLRRLHGERDVCAAAVLSDLAGIGGMLSGQLLDIQKSNEKQIELIHHLKTAALFEASARCAAMMADLPQEKIEQLAQSGRLLGRLYQLCDDLDDTEEAEEGNSYVARYGAAETVRCAQEIVNKITQNCLSPSIKQLALFLSEHYLSR